MKAVIPKIHQEKTLPKELKKAKVKMVNSSAPSDMEIEIETSAETEIRNDSIDLSTKEYFSEGEKEVNGAIEKQSNHSDSIKEPKKTKDSCFNREQKKGHIKPCSKKEILVKMEDLGPDSDCGESESQTDSETGNNIETKVSLQGEIKEKGGMKPPESSVQPSMTKMCDIDIVVQGSSVQRETKDNRNVEKESSGQHNQERINDKAVDEKEFLIGKKLKKNEMLTKSHQLRKFRMK